MQVGPETPTEPEPDFELKFSSRKESKMVKSQWGTLLPGCATYYKKHHNRGSEQRCAENYSLVYSISLQPFNVIWCSAFCLETFEHHSNYQGGWLSTRFELPSHCCLQRSWSVLWITPCWTMSWNMTCYLTGSSALGQAAPLRKHILFATRDWHLPWRRMQVCDLCFLWPL